MDVDHTAIQVRDLDATTAFYEDVLGLEFQWQFEHDGVTNYYVGSDSGASIQFKHDPAADGLVEPAGVDHLAMTVDDVDDTFERVVEASGCEVHLEPTDFEAAGRRAAFVYDPDGYVVEFVQRI
ncbi:MAG: VOC family protein [Halobacteriales archaeon]